MRPPPPERKVGAASDSNDVSPIFHLIKLVGIAVVSLLVIIAVGYIAIDSGLLSGTSSQSSSLQVPSVLAAEPSQSSGSSRSGFGSSTGKTSAAFYKSFMDEQVSCQAKAGAIRGVVERIDISPTLPDALGDIYTSPNLGGVQKALKLCAGFYARSVKNRLSLSTSGVDPGVVSFADQITAFDQQAQDIYEAYALDPSAKAPRLAVLAAQREAFLKEAEPTLLAAFEAKHGIKLPPRTEIYEQQSKLAKESAAKFLVDNGPKKLFNTLVGCSFTNTLTGGRWNVDQAEFVDGSLGKSTPMIGCIVFEVDMTLKGARSQAPCKINAVLVAAEDPALNMYWVFHARDAR